MARNHQATTETRRNADGTTTYRVRWAERDPGALAAGAPARPTYTFNTRELGDRPALAYAQRLAALVAANNGATPTREQFMACGLGWKLPVQHGPAALAPHREYVTVAEACHRYLVWKQKSMRPLSAGSLKKYQHDIRCYIEPLPLGRASIADAQTGEQTDEQDPAPDTCLAWQAQLLNKVLPTSRTGQPLTAVTVGTIRTFLSSVFKWACSPRSGNPPLRSAQNPISDMQTPPPPPVGIQKDILNNRAECALFLRITYDIDPQWAQLLVIMLVTGLRISEAIQLTPTAVDPSRQVLYITSHWGSGGQVEPGRKTGDHGQVPVPEWVMRRILIPRIRQHATAPLFRNAAGSRWHPSQHVELFKKVDPLMHDAGLPRRIRTHRLRHSYTNWLKRHLHHEVLAAALGHRRKTMTGEYIQLTDEDMTQIRDRITELVPESSWPGATATLAPLWPGATAPPVPLAADGVMLPEFRAA